MGELFDQILNMSLTASMFVLLVLVLRALLKLCVPRAPRFLYILIWVLVAVRLCSPFSIQTELSVLPYFVTQHPTFHSMTEQYVHETEIYQSGTAEFEQAIKSGRESVFAKDGSDQILAVKGSYEIPTTVKEKYFPYAANIWLGGVILMLAYAGVSVIWLRHKVSMSEKIRENIYRCDRMTAPLVLGVLFPRIYLPNRLSAEQREVFLAHGKAHIERRDALIKCFGYLLLAVYWFNPLAWLTYILLCRDLEIACDEKTVRDYTIQQKEAYGQQLLCGNVSNDPLLARQKREIFCPIAFSEVAGKQRAKAAAGHRHLPTGVMLGLSMLILTSFVFLLTDPPTVSQNLMGAEYKSKESMIYPMSLKEWEKYGMNWSPANYRYCITADYQLYQGDLEEESWEYLGRLVPYEIDNQTLQSSLPKKQYIYKISDSYLLKTADRVYLLLQTANGKTYLGCGMSDPKELDWLIKLENRLQEGEDNDAFFARSLQSVVEKPVKILQHFESKEIKGYHIVAFMTEEKQPILKDGKIEPYIADLGFAVFEAKGKGYRYLNHHLYEDAAGENGIYFSEHPAIADKNGFGRTDNRYDVILLSNPALSTIRRVYRAEEERDQILEEYDFTVPGMSLMLQKEGEDYTGVSTYCYDNMRTLLAANPPNALKATLWFDDAENPSRDEVYKRSIDGFPDSTFVCTKEELQRIEPDGSTKTLYRGERIENAYFIDVTGDAYPELCSLVYGWDGKQGQSLVVYDCKNDRIYAEQPEDYAYGMSIVNERLLIRRTVPQHNYVEGIYYLDYLDEAIGFHRIG